HFPEKYFFFDLCGLQTEPPQDLSAGFDVFVFFRDSELREQLPSISRAVTGDKFQLGCTPVVNLFEHPAETIRVSQTASEYPVIPDRLRHASMEVYSVDEVTSSAAYGEEPTIYEPFYSFRHSRHDPQTRCFWYAHRRPSPR